MVNLRQHCLAGLARGKDVARIQARLFRQRHVRKALLSVFFARTAEHHDRLILKPAHGIKEVDGPDDVHVDRARRIHPRLTHRILCRKIKDIIRRTSGQNILNFLRIQQINVGSLPIFLIGQHLFSSFDDNHLLIHPREKPRHLLTLQASSAQNQALHFTSLLNSDRQYSSTSLTVCSSGISGFQPVVSYSLLVSAAMIGISLGRSFAGSICTSIFVLL